MTIHQCKQGSEEWRRLRAGVITSSDFDQIVTPGGKLSKQWEDHAHKLIAERISGEVIDSPTSAAMAAGRYFEPEAALWYEFENSVTTEQVGFCTVDIGGFLIGASPDRLVGNDGLLEIKCPLPKTHVGYLLRDSGMYLPYKPQVQGQLLVTGRQWVDCVSYCPSFPPSCHRIHRDFIYCATLTNALEEFCARVARMEEKIRGML